MGTACARCARNGAGIVSMGRPRATASRIALRQLLCALLLPPLALLATSTADDADPIKKVYVLFSNHLDIGLSLIHI